MANPNADAEHTDSSSTHYGTANGEKPRKGSILDNRKVSTAALLRNPLAGLTTEEILADVDVFYEKLYNDKDAVRSREGKKAMLNFKKQKPFDFEQCHEDFRRGALLAQVNHTPGAYENIDVIREEEKAVLRREETHKWDQPFALYFLCTLCAGSAIVQGMDQTAVNGAQTFYYEEFQIEDSPSLQGLLNGAPYLCSALLGCWSNPILNKIGGRRFTIFFSCFISVVTGFWMAVADSFVNLLIARFALGFAVGAKSSTTPVYSAECTPKNIRGALTMMWQMWTAFGICLGFVASVVFSDVTVFGRLSPWRWMLASTAVPPMFVMAQVYFCPESPRWYMERGRFLKAYESMVRLRRIPIQATRDMYYAYKLLEVEQANKEGHKWTEFFTVRRNRRAAQSAWFTMFMQQFCGVNVIAYYSTIMFMEAGFPRDQALLASMGGGLINFFFAIPAIYTIDTFGRRNLLLVSFPLMSIFLWFTGGSFMIDGIGNTDSTTKLACVTTGMYLFMMAYSPGEGPVPFTYSAEAFPLHFRDIGMSASTAITWGFNFIISFSWPNISKAFGDHGGFFFYATWNMIGFVFTYFMLPETKGLTLEELDNVFSVRNREHAGYYTKKLPWYIKKNLLRQDVEPFPPLYSFASDAPSGKEQPTAQHSEGLFNPDEEKRVGT
ncbi:Arabinose-proton symporter-like protein [Emericellopsis cladophorae]|uniref:Arabinose-proton symporter-like protein n=1 Tax=Emericellopsis cladophorae TaxID=2686198 RepID=A0A9P9XW11_9HYPO|nr:Arabinose-proton symporter-like protein [Emericellopsis cladophorae]KAI6778711.1 Arabinose-proton symporter-like protein [Emericellopsis cladophorae]